MRDITAIINGHREGLLAVATLRNVEACIARARAAGLSVETLFVLDRPDDVTRDVFADGSARLEGSRIVTVDHGDLGLSRNSGVAAASGRWIAFLDADDMWGGNWLEEAARVAAVETRQAVWHPETNLMFGARPHIYDHPDMDDPGFRLELLALRNPWTALAFAVRQLLIEVPYPATDFARQIGFEDWGWNLLTIERGAIHKIVPGTMHAVRTKAMSLVGQSTASLCRPVSTSLFRRMIERRASESGRSVSGS